MRVLIIYATNSSGTLNAAELIQQVGQRHGHTVELIRADKIDPADLEGYDLVILGSCTWEKVVGDKHLDGQLQQHFLNLVEKMRGAKLSGVKMAVYGLGDSGYRKFAAAAEILSRFIKDIGAEQVGETLKLDRYYFEYNQNRPKVESWAENVFQQAG